MCVYTYINISNSIREDAQVRRLAHIREKMGCTVHAINNNNYIKVPDVMRENLLLHLD